MEKMFGGVCRSQEEMDACKEAHRVLALSPEPERGVGVHPKQKKRRMDDDDHEETSPSPAEAATMSVDSLMAVVAGMPDLERAKTLEDALKAELAATKARDQPVAEAAAPVPKTKRQLQEQAFEEAIQTASMTGEWNQAALGNKFQRLFGKKGPRNAEYSNVQGLAAQEAFKKTWIADTNTDIEKSKVHLKSYQKVNRRHGIYMPVGQYIESFGIQYNRELAIKAGLRGAEKMVRMGGGWCWVDPISESLFVLALKMEFIEDLKESWELSTKEVTHGSTGAAVTPRGIADADGTAASSGALAVVPAPAITTPKAKTKAEAKTAAKAAAAAKAGQGKSPKTKTESEVAVEEANKLKERYLKATGRADKIKTFIKDTPEWSWALNDRHAKILNEPLDDLAADVAKNADVQMYVTKDAKDFNKKFGKDHIAAVARKFNELLAKVRRVEKAVQKMNDLHDIENRSSQ